MVVNLASAIDAVSVREGGANEKMDRPVAIFIDDEPAVLHALRRALRSSQRDWEMAFFTDPQEALEALERREPWVIFADRMMAGMDGIELLESARERRPETIRVLLTGNVTRDTAVAGASTAHFLIRKPYEIETIRDVLMRARVLRQLPMSEHLRRELGALRSLPILPEIFHQISAELNREEPDIDRVSELIARDQGLLSKVLQVVNAPFFGFKSPTTDAHLAVMRLGLETIRSLVLIVELYHHDGGERQAKMAELMHEAVALAHVLSDLGSRAGIDTALLRDGVVCALLHNIGKLVCPDEPGDMNVDPLLQPSESATAGAYLLELWGFDPALVEALAHQDDEALPEELGAVGVLLLLAKRVFGSEPEGEMNDVPLSEAVETIRSLRLRR